MKIDNTHRDESLQVTSSVQNYLYNSPETGATLRKLYENNFLPQTSEDYRTYILLIGDIILGFYKIEDTVPLLQQELGLDAKTAALLGADVLDFLAPLSDPNFVVPVENDEGVAATVENNLPRGYDPITTPETPATTNPVYIAMQNTVAQPQATPTPYPVAPEVHTMATDAAMVRSGYQPTVPGDDITHTSEQPSFTRTLSNVPSYATPNSPDAAQQPTPLVHPPRWGN